MEFAVIAVLQWLYPESKMISGLSLKKSHLARNQIEHMNWRTALKQEIASRRECLPRRSLDTWKNLPRHPAIHGSFRTVPAPFIHKLTHKYFPATSLRHPQPFRYSSRSVVAGLMRAMRNTGTDAASRVTAASVSTTIAIVGPS